MPHKDRETRLAYHRAYYLAHKEELARQNKAYAEANKEKIQAYQAAWRSANHEELLARKRQADALYRALNKEKEQERHRKYREENKEKERIRSRKYRQEHAEKRRETTSNYSKTHRDICTLKTTEYRARKRGAAINDFTPSQWREMKELYDFRCAYCGIKPKRLSQDHLTPLSQGGNHTASNIVPACISCNSKKGTGKVLAPVQPLLLTLMPKKKSA